MMMPNQRPVPGRDCVQDWISYCGYSNGHPHLQVESWLVGSPMFVQASRHTSSAPCLHQLTSAEDVQIERLGR
eukprot:11086590-Prorocentrum_lima.AAC.1